MSEANADWTGRWALDRLQSHDQVTNVELVHPQVVRISRKSHSTFLAGLIAASIVDDHIVRTVLCLDTQIEFIANIPRESFWKGDAIELARRSKVGFGSYGDLLSAIAHSDVRAYIKKEYDFVDRGFRQHTAISDIQRVHDRLFILNRHAHQSVTVVILNEYELTADHVRVARDRYGPFTDILITNPNGKPTTSATQAAASFGANIYMWGEFLARLNRR